MSRNRTVLLRIAIGLLCGLFLFVLLLALTPRIINLEQVRRELKTAISQKFGAQFSYEKIDLRYFPSPRAIIRNGTLTRSEHRRVSWSRFEVYPQLIPLLTGSLQIARIDINSPVIDMPFARHPNSQTEQQHTKFNLAVQNIFAALSAMANLGNMQLRVENGAVRLHGPGGAIVRISSLRSEIEVAGDNTRMAASCRSDLWNDLQLDANLDLAGRKGVIQIHLQGGRPHRFSSFLFPNSKWRLTSSLVNLDLSIVSHDPSNFFITLTGSVPHLTLQHGRAPVLFKAKTIRGSVQLSPNETTVHLDRLELVEPDLQLSGRLKVGQDSPRITLQMSGTEVDIPSTRKALLELLSNHKTIRTICKVVIGGQAPRITFNTHGLTADKLTDAGHLIMSGTLRDGRIFVPGAKLDLHKVSGKIVIAQGILEGNDLRARLGNSRGWNGSLIFDLRNRNGPFHLQTRVDAFLPELPALLKRLVKNRMFRHEMELIQRLEGGARGRLTLGESLKDLHVEVAITRMKASFGYKRIPYPVNIDEGTFFYSDKHVRLEHLRGTLGKSRFSQLSASIDWENKLRFEVQSGPSRVAVDQVFAWLTSHPSIRKQLKSFKAMSGILKISSVRLEGPPLQPNDWIFQVKGLINVFSMTAAFLPGTLTASGGSFEALPKKLTFVDSQLVLEDTTITGNGCIYGYLHEFNGIDLDFKGILKPKTHRWIQELLKMPKEVRLRPPFRVTKGRLNWRQKGKTKIACRLKFGKNTRVTLAMVSSRNLFQLKNLIINDGRSSAEASMQMTDRNCDIRFKGYLIGKTLDRIFLSNEFLYGWIRGDFRVHIVMNDWKQSTAEGHLQGARLRKAWPLLSRGQWPFELKSVSLRASGNQVRVTSASIELSDTVCTITGTINVTEQGCLLDLRLSSDEIHWQDLKLLAPTGETESADRIHDSMAVRVPLEGTVHIQTKRFDYAGYTWKPMVADVRIDKHGITAKINQAGVCGIITTGTVVDSGSKIAIDITPNAQNQPLAPTILCLWNKQNLMDGVFTLNGQLISRAAPDNIISSLQGSVDFTAEKGRIYRFTALSKIFALLNVTELLRGKLPDLMKEGFAYNRFSMKGPVQNGKFIIKEGLLDGASMDIAWEGEYDFKTTTVDLTVLVAPFKTANAIIKAIPVINTLLQGKLVSIPIKVTGPLADPTVVPLAPSAVGSEILGLIERTFKLPFTLFQPLLPNTEKPQNPGRVWKPQPNSSPESEH